MLSCGAYEAQEDGSLLLPLGVSLHQLGGPGGGAC